MHRDFLDKASIYVSNITLLLFDIEKRSITSKSFVVALESCSTIFFIFTARTMFFYFSDKLYKNTDGEPKGNCVSTTLADCF